MGEIAILDGREVKHAAGSRRLSKGDCVTLFNGRGVVASAVIHDVDRRASRIEASVFEIERHPPLTPALHLACALPKGDRQSVLLNMATQLGLTSFTPLQCERTIVKAGRSFAERAKRICLEACKQCHQPHCPTIHPPAPIESVLDVFAASNAGLLMFHPHDAEPLASELSRAEQIAILIGPEGGFSDAEVKAGHRAGAKIYALGSLILRTETAAVAALACCRVSTLHR